MLSKRVLGDWFKKDVQTRWDKHNFEWIEMGDWYWRLAEFDIDTLAEPVRRHKVCDDYRTPSLKKVYDYAKTIHTRNHPPVPNSVEQTHQSTIPDTHTFIMCTKKDDRGKGTVGWFVDILIGLLNKTHSAATYNRVAAEQAARHASTYGGVWEVFTKTNQSEFLSRRHSALLNTKPLSSNGLQKEL